MSVNKGAFCFQKHPYHQKLDLSCTFKCNFNHLSYNYHAQLALVHISMETPTFHNPTDFNILFLYIQFSYKVTNLFNVDIFSKRATSALHRSFSALPTWPLWESAKWFHKIISGLSCPDTLLSAEVHTINHGWLALYYCPPTPPNP